MLYFCDTKLSSYVLASSKDSFKSTFKNVCFEIKAFAGVSEGIPLFKLIRAGDGDFFPLAGNNNCLRLFRFTACVCTSVLMVSM